MKSLKFLLISFVTLCIAYFVTGYFLVRAGYLSNDLYLRIASIAGALASVIGVLSLARRSISKSDIDQLDVEALKKVSELSKEIELAKQRRSVTEEEIARLATQKEEMQFLVKKASMALFLREQLQKNQERIGEIVSANKELAALIESHSQLGNKLHALDEEIKGDKNVDLLKEIMEIAKTKKQHNESDPFMILFRTARSVSENILGNVLR